MYKSIIHYIKESLTRKYINNGRCAYIGIGCLPITLLIGKIKIIGIFLSSLVARNFTPKLKWISGVIGIRIPTTAYIMQCPTN
jgi:hypothetical protein